eukprot:m.15446 g.15446  ORF g.15446 m.15446 type:complete len:841 (-) comp3437_c0_seq1:151-2673(-)
MADSTPVPPPEETAAAAASPAAAPNTLSEASPAAAAAADAPLPGDERRPSTSSQDSPARPPPRRLSASSRKNPFAKKPAGEPTQPASAEPTTPTTPTSATAMAPEAEPEAAAPAPAAASAPPTATEVTVKPVATAAKAKAALANCVNCNAVIFAQMNFCGACGARQKPSGDDSPSTPGPLGASEGFAINDADVPAPESPSARGRADSMSRKKFLGGFSFGRSQTTSSDSKEETAEHNRNLFAQAEEGHRIERSNMMNMAKIGIKSLIEASIGLAQPLNEEQHAVFQLLLLIEHIFTHGLKKRKFTSAAKASCWPFLESLEAGHAQLANIYAHIKTIGCKKPVGKVRAWFRLTLQEKLLSEVVRDLQDLNRNDFYEPYAFVNSDELAVLGGLLVGLHTIEFDFSLNADHLDNHHSAIDYAVYLKDGNYLKPAVVVDEANVERFSEASFTVLSDQKAMLEEQNRTLREKIHALSEQLEQSQHAHGPLQERFDALEKRAESLKQDLAAVTAEKTEIELSCLRRMRALEEDIKVERSTYETSRTGLEELMSVSHKQLETEMELRESLEADCARLRDRQQELEAAVTAAEDAAQDKEETIDALRKQLKDVKSLNIVMLQNMQEVQEKVKEKESEIHKCEREVASKEDQMQTLQAKLRDADSTKQRLENTILELTNRLKDVDAQRAASETNIMIERQWRESLQSDIAKEKERSALVDTLQASLDKLTIKHDMLQNKYDVLHKSYEEQEKTIVEMAESLSQNAMKAHDMERAQQLEMQKQWVDEKDVTECKLCSKSFGISRRKHHCRNCGDVFCNDCSDNKMPLPSSAKPVRVCDLCESQLLSKMTR